MVLDSRMLLKLTVDLLNRQLARSWTEMAKPWAGRAEAKNAFLQKTEQENKQSLLETWLGIGSKVIAFCTVRGT